MQPISMMRCPCAVERPVVVEGLPQILVLDRLFGSRFPAALLPAVHAAVDAVEHILRIGMQPDLLRSFQGVQGFDRRGELHAVVGGVEFAPVQSLAMTARNKERTPTARPPEEAFGSAPSCCMPGPPSERAGG